MFENTRKCYISYKKEDKRYRDYIVDRFGGDNFIDCSQDETIHSTDPDYIMQQLRERYINQTTVTIFLIGTSSGEYHRDYMDQIRGIDSQEFIRREIIASLWGEPKNGLLGIVLPEMYSSIYRGQSICPVCGQIYENVAINNSTTIKEFNQNYYLNQDSHRFHPHYGENERYAVLVTFDGFIKNPSLYIEKAYNKTQTPLVNEVKVRFD